MVSLGGSVDLGGTINLILSLGNHGDSHVEVLEATPRVGEEEESTEPVHRDNNMTSAPVYESVLLPRFHTKTSSSSSPSSSCSSSSGPPHPDVSISSSLPRSTSFFSSLKRRSRKRDPSRHTIQRIMFVEGEEQTEVACPAEAAPQPIMLYETQTWPTKEGRRKKKSQLKAEGVGPGQGVKLMDYMDNPLARDIDDECSGVYTVSPYAVTEAVSLAPPTSQDLNGHQYHQRLKTHRESLDLQKTSQASQMVVNLKTSGSGSMREDAIDSGISGVSNSGRLKLNATDVSQEPQPKRTVMGRLVSLEVVSKPRADPAAAPAPAHPEKETRPRNKHPDHQTETDLDSDPVHPDPVHPDPVHPDPVHPDPVHSDPVHPDPVHPDPVHPDPVHPDPVHPDPNLIIHPDHQQFEESEEELEDIWNHSDGYRQSISSDIMYQPHQEEEQGGSSNTPGLTTDTQNQAQPQAPPYRKLITASAPNLLVAEFTLPSSFQTLLGYNQGQNQDQGFSRDPDPREEIPTLANRDRRSWAAFPNQDQPWRTTALVNETAADPVKLPEIEDQKRYIYQYREEEEEEDEEEKMEDTYCPKDTSMSLRSVDMGLDRANQQARSCGTLEGVMEKQNGSGSELQRMEGTLERKHKLQLGGKKARSRAWSSHHAVLYKQTLCFYQDSKDTLRSCGLSVNLTGAECVPAPEYTKKPQCFSLRLRDGSEYLLNTASRFMMKKWMVKIQANTVPSEHVSSMTSPSSPLVQDPPSPVTTSSLSRSPHTGTARAKEIVVLTRETYPQIRQWHPGKQPDPTSSSHTGSREDNYDPLRQSPFSLQTSSSIPTFSLHSSVSPPSSSTVSRGGQDWLSQVNKHRSHSFTSARYQKIKPALLAPGQDYGSVGLGRDCGSNYSVTLVIGDKRSDASPTISCDGSGPSNTEPHHPLLDGWQQHSCHQHQATYHHYQESDQQDPSLRACTSLPRPRKKSVFKKFFGKKD
ncbi:hypothetical protein J4Q44_G00015690 [Coregonus suidteri]|uniref:PH domain-containing protein n=1 Tax=Coregonus suidteri TaxID=861788 RepID=A0AAN8MLP8_9TELE